MERNFEKFREAYETYKGAHDEHMAMMRGVLDGSRIELPEDCIESARRVQSTFAAFMDAGKPFVHSSR